MYDTARGSHEADYGIPSVVVVSVVVWYCQLTSDKISRYQGVHWNRGRAESNNPMPWGAIIRDKEGRLEWLGYFPNEESAAREHDRVARIRWPGDTTVLNFPDPIPPSPRKHKVRGIGC